MNLLLKYFPKLSQTQQEQFRQLDYLYRYWNDQINVLSRKDMDHLYERHVLHSLAIAKFIQFNAHTQVLDVGTGGGFPGIPLAIIFPQVEFTLVDSIGKKIKVVNEVSSALELNNVKGIHSRVEQIKEQFHFVTSRAVTAMPRFYPWVKKKFLKEQINERANGILALKGGDLHGELNSFANQPQIIEISDFFEEDFFDTKKIIYFEMH